LPEERSDIRRDNDPPSPPPSSPSKTRTVSLRISSKLIDELQTEADNRHISFTALANQILERYAEWGRYEIKMNRMPVPKMILSALIDKPLSIAESSGVRDMKHYRQEIIRHAAELAFTLMKDSVLLMKKEYNLETVLFALKEYMEISGIVADHHQVKHSGRHVFVIQHELGEHWSLFTKELFELIFERLANVKPEIKMTTNTTVAEVVL
jgi:hypothetical protein